MTMGEKAQPASLFERLNGEPGITAMVDLFYDRVLADPLLQGVFAKTDLEAQRRHQARFLITASGGPESYTGRSLGEAHTALHINDEQFNAFSGHLAAALKQGGVADDDIAAVVGLVGTTRSQVIGR